MEYTLVVAWLVDLMLRSLNPEEISVPILMALQCEDSQVQPKNNKYQMMKKVHNTLIGHNGVEVTLRRILESGPKWEYMRQMVTRSSEQCGTCGKSDPRSIKTYVEPYTQREWSDER